MMPIELNLLSPAKKAKLHALVKFLFIKENLELILLTAVLLGITHLGGWLILTGVVRDLSESTTLVNRDVSRYSQELRQRNQLVQALFRSSRAFIPLSPKLRELAELMPGEVKLTALELDRERGRLLLTGLAQNRAALLNLQAKLSALPWIAAVSIPSAQLFQKQNVDFEIRAALQDLAWAGAPPPRLAPVERAEP